MIDETKVQIGDDVLLDRRMKCIWQMDGDDVKGFKCDFTPIDMLIVISGLRYITADTERHAKDRERAKNIYNQIMLGRYSDEADRKTEPQTCSFSDCDNFKNPDYERCIECKRKKIKLKTEP